MESAPQKLAICGNNGIPVFGSYARERQRPVVKDGLYSSGGKKVGFS